jgi:ABC-type transport system involved in multi-copper enzyme maturation permease subunit
MLKKLLWKEWKENLWKLTFGVLVSGAFEAMLLRLRIFPDQATVWVISLVQMLAVPVIYSLDIFSGEMSNRTILLLFNLPAERWKIFFSKYFISILGIALIFVFTGLLAEGLARGREVDAGGLMKMSAGSGAAALILFTWFCGFGAQSRSEAGSLVAMFGVMIGWGIFFFWSSICQVVWALRFTPYCLIVPPAVGPLSEMLRPMATWLSQISGFVVILCIACFRFVKVRRYL